MGSIYVRLSVAYYDVFYWSIKELIIRVGTNTATRVKVGL